MYRVSDASKRISDWFYQRDISLISNTQLRLSSITKEYLYQPRTSCISEPQESQLKKKTKMSRFLETFRNFLRQISSVCKSKPRKMSSPVISLSGNVSKSGDRRFFITQRQSYHILWLLLKYIFCVCVCVCLCVVSLFNNWRRENVLSLKCLYMGFFPSK